MRRWVSAGSFSSRRAAVVSSPTFVTATLISERSERATLFQYAAAWRSVQHGPLTVDDARRLQSFHPPQARRRRERRPLGQVHVGEAPVLLQGSKDAAVGAIQAHGARHVRKGPPSATLCSMRRHRRQRTQGNALAASATPVRPSGEANNDRARVARLDDVGGRGIYEALLKTEIFPGILAKQVAGFSHIKLFCRAVGQEVEFMTVMWFASQEAVTAFVGEDHGVAYVPASARLVLARFDERAVHYEVRERRDAMGSVKNLGRYAASGIAWWPKRPSSTAAPT